MTRAGAVAGLVALASVGGCSCGATVHTRAHDASLGDGGPGTECRTARELWGDETVPPWPVWPSDRAIAGFTQAECEEFLAPYSSGAATVTWGDGCWAGHWVDRSPPWNLIHCGDTFCPWSQICVNDGEERCADICLRERTPVHACAPVAMAIPWAIRPIGMPVPVDVAEAAHGCRLWAQGFAPPGTHAIASLILDGGGCGVGDVCRGTFDPGALPTCTCGGASCNPSEVCVIDEHCPVAAPDAGAIDAGQDAGAPAPDGGAGCDPHCVPACWWSV